MDMFDLADKIENKQEFEFFLKAFSNDFKSRKEEWENPNLERFLDAMERFLHDSNEQSINNINFTPSWSLFAKIMIAASTYE